MWSGTVKMAFLLGLLISGLSLFLIALGAVEVLCCGHSLRAEGMHRLSLGALGLLASIGYTVWLVKSQGRSRRE